MKKKTKMDFLLINKRLNGNFNGGDNPYVGPTKVTTRGEELKMKRAELDKSRGKNK